MSERTFVIVGAGLAGARAAEALRDQGFEGSVVLVGREAHLPYDRPPLSKGYLQGSTERGDVTLHPQEWYDERNIEVRTGAEVTAIELADHHVVLDGGETLAYDRLLLATGSSARRLDLPGADLDGVLTLRSVEDSEALRAAFDPAARVVVVGGGWIGLEAAAAARAAGAAVTVLESAPQPLLGVLGPRIAEVFADLHREHGVDLRTEVTVEAFEEAELDGTGTGRVGAVRLADGTRLAATVVLVGVGAVPNLELADAAGLAVDNGVIVDSGGRTSDADVFAAGDIAHLDNPAVGERIRVEHWANAHDQPVAVVAAMLDQGGEFDLLPFFYTDQYDLGMELVGYNSPDDDVVIRGDTSGKREFIAFWLRDGKLTAGMAVNLWDQVDDLKAIIAAGHRLDPERLVDPRVPLSSFAAE